VGKHKRSGSQGPVSPVGRVVAIVGAGYADEPPHIQKAVRETVRKLGRDAAAQGAKSYICGPYAKAATALLGSLKAKGIPARVGYFSRNRNRTLIVQVGKKDLRRIPKEYLGFKVTAEATQIKG
jgi:hypothetical protein